MKTSAGWFALVFLLLLLPIARAEQSDNEYILGPDDVLDISVLNHKDLDRQVVILPDGNIGFPEVGTLKAAGKTPRSLASEIQAGLEKFRNRVFVTVSVKEQKSQKARILGAVKSSGSYDVKRNFRLMDLVALAGGLNSRPGRVTGKIVRENQIIPIVLSEAVAMPDSEKNPPIKNGDLVLLEEQEVVKQVRVLGQVEKPGAFDLSETTTVLSLLAEAGGQKREASLARAYVQRGEQKIPMNLVPTLLKNQKDDAVTGFKLQPGDVLVLPESEERFAVLGNVSKPGYYPLSEQKQMTLLEALSTAGGQTQEAELRQAGIMRYVDGKPMGMKVNIDEMLRKGDLSKNVIMQPGDILFIPSRKRREMNLIDYLTPLGFFLNIVGI